MAPEHFSLGVNYWPRRTAMAMWRSFDAGEIAEDFARIAELGLDAVRVFLRWDDFAPRPATIDDTMLARFQTVVELASDAGIQTVPVLCCGHMSGVNFVPPWALDPKLSRGRFRTISGNVEAPFAVGNPYTGALLEAQACFARAVGERVRGNKTIRAWDIGHAFSNLRDLPRGRVSSGEHSTEPAAAPQVAEWSRGLAAALQETSDLPVTAGTHAADVTEERSLRLESLCAPLAFASMQGSSIYSTFARSRLDPEVVPFLATLAASFSYKPVLVTGFGNPTCPPQKFSAFERFPGENEPPGLTIAGDDPVFATYPCLTESENAAYCTNVLERLHADGRLGAFWWCWADYGEELQDTAPFDAAPYELTCGIIRSDGSEKPVAGALRAFAAERRRTVEPDDMPLIASTYYYRTLPSSTRTLYDAFLRYVKERPSRR